MSAEEYLAGKGKEYRNTPFLKAYGHDSAECICGYFLHKMGKESEAIKLIAEVFYDSLFFGNGQQ